MSTGAHSGSTAPLALLRAFAKSWWLMLLRGIVTIAFGILLFIWPSLTLLTLTWLWGAYALADGVLALWSAVAGKGSGIASRWWLALIGIAGILAGLMAFVWPGITIHVLLVLVASWAIITGVLEIWGAIRLKREIEAEWMMALSGLLSVVLGLILLTRPGADMLAVAWLIGSLAILVGCIYVSLALWLKTYRPTGPSRHAKPKLKARR
jgi:uncharacterized membrane protein HdeD (DUF308 family)